MNKFFAVLVFVGSIALSGFLGAQFPSTPVGFVCAFLTGMVLGSLGGLLAAVIWGDDL